jgi:hypothetical protein
MREGKLQPMEIVKLVHAAEAERSPAPPSGKTRGQALKEMFDSLMKH